MREYRDKPSPGLIRVLNELAGLSAILHLAGTPEAEADAALGRHAEARVDLLARLRAERRPASPGPRDDDGERWIDGRWIRPSAASRDDP